MSESKLASKLSTMNLEPGEVVVVKSETYETPKDLTKEEIDEFVQDLCGVNVKPVPSSDDEVLAIAKADARFGINDNLVCDTDADIVLMFTELKKVEEKIRICLEHRNLNPIGWTRYDGMRLKSLINLRDLYTDKLNAKASQKFKSTSINI